jgi:ribosomal protein S18 acetylase RimI-like enzyme
MHSIEPGTLAQPDGKPRRANDVASVTEPFRDTVVVPHDRRAVATARHTVVVTTDLPLVRLEPATDREALVPLLLEADESEPVLRSYLDDGTLYRIVSDDRRIGAVLLLDEAAAVEIKNFVIAEPHRGRGFGRAAVEAVIELARRAGAERLVVGTADTSTGAIAFYRRVGFEAAGRVEGFFDAYPEPVIEDGVVAHDMLRFELRLSAAI